MFFLSLIILVKSIRYHLSACQQRYIFISRSISFDQRVQFEDIYSSNFINPPIVYHAYFSILNEPSKRRNVSFQLTLYVGISRIFFYRLKAFYGFTETRCHWFQLFSLPIIAVSVTPQLNPFTSCIECYIYFFSCEHYSCLERFSRKELKTHIL